MRYAIWQDRYKCVYDIVNELVYRSGWSIEDALEFINSIEDADVVSRMKYDTIKDVARIAAGKYRKILTQVGNEWVAVGKGLPKESGRYLTLVGGHKPSILDYSAKHKLFNAFDFFDEERGRRVAIEITHWMPLPEPPKEG